MLVEAGDLIPSDGEVIEGIASVNEAAITGESAPVIRESGGDRSAVTGGTLVVSDWLKVRITAAQGSTFLDRMIALVEGAAAPEDAERDRAEHPARRHDHHLRLRHGDHPELCGLCRRHDFGRRSRGAVRDADPDHHRRAAVGHRHRRHGSAGALQRARHVGPRRRGGRRRRHAASRQDRHHHARQSSGGRVQARLRRERAGAGRRGAARLACRRDPRGALHRRARQGEIRHSRPRHPRARRQVHSVHGAEPDERRRDRRFVGPQGRGRCHPRLSQDFGAQGRGSRSRRAKSGCERRADARGQCPGREHRQIGRHAARRRQGRQAARRHSPQGHRQRRHPRALRRASPHGHPHRHDHRRQSHDRGGDRR